MAIDLPWTMQNEGAPSSFETIADLIGKFAQDTYPNLRGVSTKRTGNIADELGQIMRAMYDPGSPMYQNAYKQNRQSSRNNIAEFLMEAGRQNRKLASLGRVPLFDPERGGETQFRSMIKAYQDADATAHDDTLRQLGGASLAGRGLFGIESDMAQTQAVNRKKKGIGIADIASALPIIGRLF